MKIAVVMPIECYDGLLRKCEALPPEYEMLRNAIINRAEGQETTVEIACDLERAEKLLDLARRIHPDAAPSIEESIRLKREL